MTGSTQPGEGTARTTHPLPGSHSAALPGWAQMPALSDTSRLGTRALSDMSEQPVLVGFQQAEEAEFSRKGEDSR